MKKPNILLVMTDQQRADLTNRENFPLDVTPFLDSIAKEGTWFDKAYSASPVCAPSRVSTLTGRFPSAHGVRDNKSANNAFFESDLIDVVKNEGYHTALIGKNHSHLNKEKMDHYYILDHNAGFGNGVSKNKKEEEFDQWLNEINHSTVTYPSPFPKETQGPYRAVSEAERWIDSVLEEDESNPFFMWLSFAEPHNPYQVPDPYYSLFPLDSIPPPKTNKGNLKNKGFKWSFTRELGEHFFDKYEEEIPRARANYLGMLRLIDDQIKRLIEYLKSINQYENTLIIFVSDHGDFVGEYGLLRKGPGVPELLMRVPLFIKGPGIKAHKEPHSAFVSLVDIMPTICDYLEVNIPNGVQGRSLLPLLKGDDYPEEEFQSIFAEQGYGGLHLTENDGIDYDQCKIIGPKQDSFDEVNSYTQSGIMRMVRKGEWKLTYDMNKNGELYNLTNDPLELNNLIDNPEYYQVKIELLIEITSWLLRTQDPLPLPSKEYIYKKHPKNYWYV